MKEIFRKYNYILIVLCIVFLTLCFYNASFNVLKTNVINKEEKLSSNVVWANKLIANSTDTNSMKHNTTYLQGLVDSVSNQGGGTIHLPKGTFHFSAGGNNYNAEKPNKYWVIHLRHNVIIEGEGTNENTGTILKPVGNHELPLDMFYFNKFYDLKIAEYLENVGFRNFVIDGSMVFSTIYNSAGKGIQANLVKNSFIDNVVVKNTWATGIAFDHPVNCTISNSTAIGCGRGGNSSSTGGSGFGIGTGHSENESLTITNCTAMGNRKFGIFFEHQARFATAHTATKAVSFKVINSTASNNMYDFGGEKAHDVVYQNCKSYVGSGQNPLKITTVAPIHFGTNTVRVDMINSSVSHKFNDVKDSSKYYYIPVYWALNEGIIEYSSNFQPSSASTRAWAITLLWRMVNRPGDVILKGRTTSSGFSDVPIIDWGEEKSWYSQAAKWGRSSGILDAVSNFYPNNSITRAEMISILWKHAGKPIVNTKNNFSDVPGNVYYTKAVNWAASKGIIKGDGGKFSPNDNCSRADVVTMLYRYSNSTNTSANNNINQTQNSASETTKVPTTSPTPTNNSNSNKNNSTSSSSSSSNKNNSTSKPSLNDKNTTNNSNNKQPNTNTNKDSKPVLSELYLSNGFLNFNSEEKKYEVYVPYNVDEIEIYAKTSDSNTKVTGTGTKNLAVGNNNYKLEVSNDKGIKEVYEVSVVRRVESSIDLNNNRKLKELIVSGTAILLSENQYIFEYPYKNGDVIEIKATAEADTSNVVIVGNENLKDGKEIKVIVTAENGESSIYTILLKDRAKYTKFVTIGGTCILLILVIGIIVMLVKMRKANQKLFS